MSESDDLYHGIDRKMVIKPPAKIKEIIDKTAKFISEKGEANVQKLLENNSDKFSFLTEDSPYNKYYLWVYYNCKDEKGMSR